MTLNTRMLPLAGANTTGYISSGAGSANQRVYSAAGGSFIDALGSPDAGDAASLSSQGFIPICASGPTSSRPAFATTTVGVGARGVFYLDTTIPKIVVWDGANWRDPVTGSTA
jgi:hypothetical protein